MLCNLKWIGLTAAAFGAGILLSCLLPPKWLVLVAALLLVVAGIAVCRKHWCC